MAQWANTDAANDSPVWGPALLNKAPGRAAANTLFGNTTADGYITGRTDGVFGVDGDEVQGGAGGHTGFSLKVTGSGGRAGRVIYETLVALSSLGGSDADAGTVPNFLIVITSQPPATKSVAAGANTTISATAETKPLGKTITYQWEANSGSGFANLSNAGLYSNVTTATLSISSANSTANNVSYRLVIRGTNAANVTTQQTTLSVTA